ncbi:UNVERIFIED_CONTAM: hypothetical protein FKN15_044717 [Acipenser sinensis]
MQVQLPGLIFVGGVPRSGTTLMRAMLDAHPEIRCGEETRIIPRLLAMRQAWSKSEREKMRLDEAGVTDQVLDSAVRAFILEVIARHGEPAQYLCNKDPFTLKSSLYLSHLFPNSRFLLLLRDGRASVHSMISRKVTIAGFDLSSYRDCLVKWNKAVEAMYSQCLQVGPSRCKPVHYEQLVLHPRRSMQEIMRFLDIRWDEAVLHHEDAIGKPGGVSLSKTERSTDQVIKPVNLEALSKWVGHIPVDVLMDMNEIAPMLTRLGYDPNANPPNYGSPDPLVVIKPVNLEALSKWVGHIPVDVLMDMNEIAPMLTRLGYDPNANPPNYGSPDPLVVNNTQRVGVVSKGSSAGL